MQEKSKVDLPEVFTVVNDLEALPKPSKKQYRCEDCHQLQHAANRARHAERCTPAYLLSHI